MKVLALLLLAAATAPAQSHPSWWSYASPQATTLVGIRWSTLRNTPFAGAVEAELSSSGPLGFPDLDCLRQAKQIVISSPDLLAIAAGDFPSSTVAQQARKAGLRRYVYRGVTLWIPSNTAALGLAQINEQIVLVAARKALEASIDESLLDKDRQYSALLPHAARFSQSGDLWVVALALPDPLASLFVPLDMAATGFEGEVSVGAGLHLDAMFDAGTVGAADAAVRELQKQVPTFPAIARALQVASDQSIVTLQLDASPEELNADLHSPAPARGPAPVSAPAAATLAAPAAQAAVKIPAAAAKPAPAIAAVAPAAAAPPPAPEPKPAGPQIIRIIGLDDGPREIRLPPSQ